MTGFPTLETKRLILREIVPADADALFAIHGDPEAMRWYGNDPMTEPGQARKLFEIFASWRTLPNPGTRWGLEEKEGGALIGTCGLFRWNRSWRSCTLGYELARSSWGRRFMAEALSRILSWGFQAMELNRIEAQILRDNETSLKLMRGLGFVEEGLMREAGYWGGRHHDLVQFSLLRRDGMFQGSDANGP